MKLISYLHSLQAQGRCCFTLDEAANANPDKSRGSIILALKRLKAKKEIASPAKGFYVLVTPEFQILGCLPAEYFIPYLMEYWNYKYYVGLLTAAAYHGAAHQAPQIFQVVVEQKLRPIHCGKIKIEFITKKNMGLMPTQFISTPKSRLKIATPEVTLIDLFQYPHRCGGLNHIVTVLDELHDKIQPNSLSELLSIQSETAWIQRLGYLLEKIEDTKLISLLKDYLSKQQRVNFTPLMSGLKLVNSSQDKRDLTWKIIENATIESDI